SAAQGRMQGQTVLIPFAKTKGMRRKGAKVTPNRPRQWISTWPYVSPTTQLANSGAALNG
ncbi:MAG: hypothetical protein RR222_18015, partial [Pseudomonas sp.]|uniref:hypothetical protein n=1 Tax=Pseudomonas sp. TaxID=306 RepID=UPI002FCB4356